MDELLRQIDIPAMEQAMSKQYKSQIRRRWELPADYWMLLERCCGLRTVWSNDTYADLNPVVGSEQGGIRPVLVIQNDVGNHFSPTVVAAAITSRKAKNSLPTHILLENVPGLAPTSLLLLEQLRTIDRKRLRGYIGRISKEKMLEVDAALAISIGIGYPNERRTHNV